MELRKSKRFAKEIEGKTDILTIALMNIMKDWIPSLEGFKDDKLSLKEIKVQMASEVLEYSKQIESVLNLFGNNLLRFAEMSVQQPFDVLSQEKEEYKYLLERVADRLEYLENQFVHNEIAGQSLEENESNENSSQMVHPKTKVPL